MQAYINAGYRAREKLVEDNQMKVWAQMFFDDGSVTQGIRVPVHVFDDIKDIRQIAVKLLQSVHRSEGLLLIWGAGTIFYRHYDFDSIFPAKRGESSESETSQA